ncbi:hypothetical protein [Neobacillus niacini]|uniref:hypothetical protein n=1 Tax=Neobacillus niacini TaxID=86668 RepID=UPI0028584E06|nr:hypothetical protein [Neobacillus niacini]MDR7000683.1 hypothetical protein [Neobacillus niacini]
MYFHIVVAVLCWVLAILIPSLSDSYMVTLMVLGFIALLFFLRELLRHVNKNFLDQVEEAENSDIHTVSSFQGTFVTISDEESPFSDEFTYIIFRNGSVEVPLFCRNLRIIQKAARATSELIIYYKDHILVNVEELDD